MKFVKGQSGNPNGRPKGARSQAKLREAIAKELPDIIEALVGEAKGGDTSAAKLLLDRALPALRPVDQPAPLALPEGLGQPGREILAALGSGQITPDQAQSCCSH